jgi:hypothetical protein
MKRTRHSSEQVINKLREADATPSSGAGAGAPVPRREQADLPPLAEPARRYPNLVITSSINRKLAWQRRNWST